MRTTLSGGRALSWRAIGRHLRFAGTNVALAVTCAHAFAANGAESYDLDELGRFLDGVGGSIEFSRARPVFPDEESDTFCYELDVFDPVTETWDRFDEQRAIEVLGRHAVGAGKPSFEPEDERCVARVALDTGIFEIDLVTYGTRRLAASDEDEKPREAEVVRSMWPMWRWDRREDPSPDGSWFATLIGDDFGMRSAATDDVIRFTEDGTPRHRYFYAGDLWERSGSAWSPDSRYFLGRLHDTRHTNGILMLDQFGKSEELMEFNYWTRAGDPLPITRFVIFDRKTRGTIPVEPAGSEDSHSFFIDWNHRSDAVAFVRFKRDASELELFEADVETGRARKLLAESRAEGWVKWPQGPKILHYLPSGAGFLWRSDRDGFFNYYLHDSDGSLACQLTAGRYDAGGVVAVDEDGGRFFFMAGSVPARPFDSQLHVAPLKCGGEVRRITEERGIHEVTMSPTFDYFVDLHHHVDRAPVLEVRRVSDGSVVERLAEARVPGWRREWPMPEEFTAFAADGETPVHGLIFKPHDFDPDVSYPVLERIYGAMQIRVTPRGYFGFRETRPGSEYTNLIAYLASKGFVVVTIDSPGTPGRGREYQLRTYGTWPEGVVDDHVAVLRQLAADRPWMDAERIGIVGNSWGGYMALRSGIEAPDVYKAVSASVPVTDLVDHVAWIEWMLGTIDENPSAYEAGNLTSRMKNWEPGLQLIAGTADVNVPVSNTMKLLDALAEHGKRYELVLFPGTNHTHNGQGDRYRYTYAVAAIADFMERQLLED